MLIVLAACSGDEEQEDSNENEETESAEIKEISIGLDPYDYSTVPAYLSQVILEQEGYDVTIESIMKYTQSTQEAVWRIRQTG